MDIPHGRVFILVHAVPPQKRNEYRGRGTARPLVFKPEAQGATFISASDPVAHWWATVTFLLEELVSCLPKREARFESLLARVRELASQLPTSSLMPLSTRLWGLWKDGLLHLDKATDEELVDFGFKARHNATRSHRALQYMNQQSFKEWALKQYVSGETQARLRGGSSLRGSRRAG